MGRAPCCDKANVKRGPWSPEEDGALRSYLEKHGTGGNWIALPHKAGLRRCGKSCRLRWLNYLRPDIKHGGFTEEEDNIICTLYRNIGSRWSVIASHLPGRTDNDVKNYWNTKLKKKVLGDTKKAGPNSPMAQLLALPPMPTVKTEAYTSTDFSTSLDSGFGLINQEAYRFLPEFPPLPMPYAVIEQPLYEDGSSATSSSVENWPAYANSDGNHDLFLSELGFGSYGEFLNGFSEVAPSYSSSNLASKAQGQYQSVTYS